MWRCTACTKEVDTQFDRCWNCGANKLGEPDPEFRHADQYVAEFSPDPPVQKTQFSLKQVLVLNSLICVCLVLFRRSPLALTALIALLLIFSILYIYVNLYSEIFRYLKPPKDEP